ncbi:DUF6273 domain-containing protein [uncultured Duncaniella sp.]|uniref:DUF6273 domain-containing protein n=1 Tax=uncultured Duncaniella sp. TaxID=2768039 RepID=UPI0026340124|nr:DUF6273 domain-containing protein [uncultured Duncaniella sp.]
MATLKQRLHRKNSSGTYDTIHLETSADLVLMSDGSTKLTDKITSMDTAISGKAAASHTHTTISGNAGTATKLATARTIRTNLASTATASFDGSGNVTPGVTGVLGVANGGTGVASIAALKTALGIGSGGSGEILTDVPTTLGASYRFAGYDWTVVHVINNLVYAIMTDIFSTTTFGSNNTYSGSVLAGCCEGFQNALTSAEAAVLAPVSVNGVTCKVFVPSYDQFNGGFSYFNSSSRRIAKYNGSATTYWTSSPYGSGSNVYCVSAGGSLVNYYPSTAHGFRPCVAFKRQA